MRLLIAESDYGFYAEQLAVRLPQLHCVAAAEPEQLLSSAGDCELWLGEPDRLATLLRHVHKPAWLQSTWAGITPLLAADLPRDYHLSRAVGIFGQVMAEYVLGHMLAHQRRHAEQRIAQQQRRWDGQLPRSLAGRKVLIVGCGDIGGQVAQFLSPFNLQLRGVASSAREQAPFERVEALAQLSGLIGWADYVINLLPDTPVTHDVYDAALFAQMQPHALFINAGRGAAVVDEALVTALNAGQLAGAVIDVCRQEPLPAEHAFWHTPNLLLTGHSSAPTDPQQMLELFIENVARWRRAEPLRGEVDFARGY